MQRYRLILVLLSGLLGACGSGGGSSDGGGDVISGYVPYLLSSPTVSSAPNGVVTDQYDVTVTLEADGPTGVQSVLVWIFNTATLDGYSIDLVNTPGTTTWSGSTHPLVPMVAGNYTVDEVIMEDIDYFSVPAGTPIRAGWYIGDSFFSSTYYYVDERETSGVDFLFYNFGVSRFPITHFTLP